MDDNDELVPNQVLRRLIRRARAVLLNGSTNDGSVPEPSVVSSLQLPSHEECQSRTKKAFRAYDTTSASVVACMHHARRAGELISR